MEVIVQYEKKRSEFGHHCTFEDSPARILESTVSSHEHDKKFLVRQPAVTTLDTQPRTAEHSVNTDTVISKSQGMKHTEGGWPENVDGTEAEQVERYLKKANKDQSTKMAVQTLGFIVDTCIKQNNTIDIYENYFEGESVDVSSEPPSAKGLAVFRDAARVKRTVTGMHWHPDGDKLAAAYSILNFQDDRMMHGRLPMKSFVWDVANPNQPMSTLVPPSPLVSLRWNHKMHTVLAGGSYNGLVHVFDVRADQGSVLTAQSTSEVSDSHHDPVYGVHWINSKTNRTFVSTSTDGQLLFWDMSNLSKPYQVMHLYDKSQRLLGGSSIDYNPEAQGKFLVGTEQGVVCQVNTKKKGKDMVSMKDAGAGKHHGPIYDIHRNPQQPAYFMTVGDWTARVWTDDNVSTPLLTTPYCKSYLTGGAWSPTRAGVFFTIRMDGLMDCWDLFHRQSAVAYSHKVSDFPLSSISVQGSAQSGGGRLLAVGDSSGTVSLLEVSSSLAQGSAAEKQQIDSMLKRESNRERNLFLRSQELARKARRAEQQASDAVSKEAGGKEDEMEETLRKVDAEFLAMIKEAEEDDDKDVEEDEEDGAASGAGR